MSVTSTLPLSAVIATLNLQPDAKAGLGIFSTIVPSQRQHPVEPFRRPDVSGQRQTFASLRPSPHAAV